MDSDEDLLTVVVPVWDAYVADLAEAVESVRRQSIRARILVVDNASAMSVPELDGASIVRSSIRLSVGSARNYGLERVSTPYVVFLDADDLLIDGALETMLALARTRPRGVAWVLGIVDGTTGCRHRSPRRLGRCLAPVPPVFAVANAVWSLLPTQGSTLLRTARLRQVGGYDDSQRGGDDAPFSAALAFRGPVAFSSTPGLIYRWGPASPGGPETSRTLIAANLLRVRRRLGQDRGLQAWARYILPILPPSHFILLNLVRPAVRWFRQIRARVRSPQTSSDRPGARPRG